MTTGRKTTRKLKYFTFAWVLGALALSLSSAVAAETAVAVGNASDFPRELVLLPEMVPYELDSVPACLDPTNGSFLKEPDLSPRQVFRRVLRFGNLDKVFWPQEGLTKGDLLAYYRAVAPVLVPHLRGRPFTMKRFPDGIAGKAFFQKDAPSHLPAW